MTESSIPSILLANEPRSYRQALVVGLRAGHSDVKIIAVAPDELDAAVALHRPVLVVCDTLTPVVETEAPVWVLLYPDGARLVVTSVFGARRYAADLGLEELSRLVERALGEDARHIESH